VNDINAADPFEMTGTFEKYSEILWTYASTDELLKVFVSSIINPFLIPLFRFGWSCIRIRTFRNNCLDRFDFVFVANFR